VYRALFALLLLASAPAQAETAEEIMDKARAARQVENAIQTIEMSIVGKNGSKRVRELELKVKVDGDIRKSIARFTSPSDVAGTSLLLIDHPDTVDEQLLYLPAVKRTNRISGNNRKGSFMGSDFSYEDMEMSDPPDANHTVISEAGDTWVIETAPGEDSSYSKLISTVRKADFVPVSVQFFDKDGDLLKALAVSKTNVLDGLTLVTESTMSNVQKSTSTILLVKAQQMNVPEDQLPDSLFTKASLESGK
jgi:hypothetical protein